MAARMVEGSWAVNAAPERAQRRGEAMVAAFNGCRRAGSWIRAVDELRLNRARTTSWQGKSRTSSTPRDHHSELHLASHIRHTADPAPGL